MRKQVQCVYCTGDHDIPGHIGVIDNAVYSGVHLNGFDGKKLLTTSVQNILVKAGLIIPEQKKKLSRTTKVNTDPTYDAMEVLRSAIRSRSDPINVKVLSTPSFQTLSFLCEPSSIF